MSGPDGLQQTPLLELSSVSKAFDGIFAVEGVDLALQAREMRCIIGPNGCGKSTLFNLITGYLPPTAGAIRWQGRSLAGLALHEIARLGILRKFQVPSVFPTLTVEANIRASLAAYGSPARPGSIDSLLALVRLEPLRRNLAGVLSHGQKQWLELAMILACEPKLILLDEPVAGMTRPERADTARLLTEIRARSDLSVLIIEHDMDFVASLGCPVSVMMLGRMIVSGSFDDIRRDSRVGEAYLGSAYA